MELRKETNLYNDDAIQTGMETVATQKAQQAVSALDQQAIFNRLTNNGSAQGIFLESGQLYINMSYLQTGTLRVGGVNNVNGIIEVFNSSSQKVITVNQYGISVTKDNKTTTILDSDGFRSNDYTTASSTTSTTVQRYMLLDSGMLRSKKLQNGVYVDNGYLYFTPGNKVILESLGNQLHLISNNGIYFQSRDNSPIAFTVMNTTTPKVTINTNPIIVSNGSGNNAIGYIWQGVTSGSQWVGFGTFGGANIFVWADTSDDNIKRNIVPSTENALEAIKKIGHYAFEYKAGGYRKVGYIAQQLEKVIPHAVVDVEQKDDRGNKMNDKKQIHDHEILVYATKAIQELHEKVVELETRINNM